MRDRPASTTSERPYVRACCRTWVSSRHFQGWCLLWYDNRQEGALRGGGRLGKATAAPECRSRDAPGVALVGFPSGRPGGGAWLDLVTSKGEVVKSWESIDNYVLYRFRMAVAELEKPTFVGFEQVADPQPSLIRVYDLTPTGVSLVEGAPVPAPRSRSGRRKAFRARNRRQALLPTAVPVL